MLHAQIFMITILQVIFDRILSQDKKDKNHKNMID